MLLVEIVAKPPAYPSLAVPPEQAHVTADATVFIVIHSRGSAIEVPNAHLVKLSGIGYANRHATLELVIAAINRTTAQAGLGED